VPLLIILIQLHIISYEYDGYRDIGSASLSSLNPSKHEERERERASFLLEGSQVTPARPSGRNNVKVKTLW
jgi:hypothetical protein